MGEKTEDTGYSLDCREKYMLSTSIYWEILQKLLYKTACYLTAFLPGIYHPLQAKFTPYVFYF